MTSIKLLKLKTNEDLICIFEENDSSFVLSYPMNVYIEQDLKTMGQNLVMNFWIPFNLAENQDAEIKKDNVIAILEPNKEFKIGRAHV